MNPDTERAAEARRALERAENNAKICDGLARWHEDETHKYHNPGAARGYRGDEAYHRACANSLRVYAAVLAPSDAMRDAMVDAWHEHGGDFGEPLRRCCVEAALSALCVVATPADAAATERGA